MRAKLYIALGALVTVGWAVPNAGTAHFIVRAAARDLRAEAPMLRPARLRISKERGLLVSAWVGG